MPGLTGMFWQAGSDYEFSARVAEIHSVKVIRCNMGYPQLILNLHTGCSPPPFFFQTGNIMEFRQSLAEVQVIQGLFARGIWSL